MSSDKTKFIKAKMLLYRWMELSHPNWQRTAASGGEQPGSNFATKLQADTAELLNE